jgi:hypothetical protein
VAVCVHHLFAYALKSEMSAWWAVSKAQSVTVKSMCADHPCNGNEGNEGKRRRLLLDEHFDAMKKSHRMSV